ncbi:DNA-binding SARP family transcriptional activator [Streptomyces sp. T12]|uniref:AfsR/SARP family transcriptional regulator n=1 Tax=Streptomyces sp. T12 TaxID=477697 RepID=UPI0011A22F30|nr:AfsR/SARP family transcriptional regulator [Streptomyces sp. T12]TWD17663.1 DNA-binding SARP family transcriptional activator [Streptomyces sp. T12]
MRFQLLGPLCIADGEHAVVLQPSKPTNLLATLLIHSGRVVSANYLLHTVWDTEPPATARAALQSCVLRLRRLFAKYGIAHDTIESVPGGYRMRADPSTLDLANFRALVGSAEVATDHATEARLLRQALSLWQGPPLPNVTSQTLHRDEVPRLTEERLGALERLCDIELDRGRCRQALTEVWEAARRHPERERFSEQLIEALYRTGRQTEALVEFETVRERLKEDLGVDPGAALQRLHLAILRGENLARPGSVDRRTASLQPPAPLVPELGSGDHTPPAQVGAVNAPVEVPADSCMAETSATAKAPPPALGPVPCFAGRVSQLDVLREMLSAGDPQGNLVVISGAPGIGKTAFALQAAHLTQHAFPGGHSLVRMNHRDGRPLCLSEMHAQHPPGRNGNGRRLLILDDAVSAEQIRPLLLPDSEGTTMVTSRCRLSGLAATHGSLVLRLDVLTEEEAEQLLVNVLGAERVGNEPDAVRALARLCGFFPMSLRIAAARLTTRPHLSIADCVRWLSEDLLPRLHLPDEPHVSVLRMLDSALLRLSPQLREAFVLLAAGAPDGLVRSVPSAAEGIVDQLGEAGFIEDGPPTPCRIHPLFKLYARQYAPFTNRVPSPA